MSNVQKTPLSRTLPAYVTQRSQDEISKLGLAIPGHVTAVTGAIVTIAFDVTGLTLSPVQMPIGSPEYIRLPIQVGDKGLAVPASFYLGGVSGLGGGTATDGLQGNLSTLFWVPLGSKGFSAVDPNVLTLYGPQGVTIRDLASGTVLKLTPSSLSVTAANSISFSAAGHTIVVNSTGVIIDGKTFLLHDHQAGALVAGSTPVTGISGPVV